MPRTKLSALDLACILLILMVALVLLWSPWQGTQRGEILLISTPEGQMEYALDVDRTVSLSSRGIKLLVEIRDGAAYVKESDCPDGVCLASRPIRQSGETVLCAPAGVRLTVKGGDADVDFVAG